ncbi:hypothetical protein TWF173_006930 [Orbilia oligospora]|uniref:Uncharacterized protein n=1 Tax=Arthrobotrys oligospora (strain ATCC 24927 / CBS 115.81 / DSM 1491) TaxID=756982 RepID=G1XPI2_ARTOA|nr:hypothetical protein AOL_s00173g350 [Orbilia oligospora ATCC 24927]EGX45249.1 hypothetical protein AOL_s00173g350 [Orbilia oligospora ATCC 24927]KAF3312709.1 hypothetical protein TWF173_006930 [Orbilia oligospora]
MFSRDSGLSTAQCRFKILRKYRSQFASKGYMVSHDRESPRAGSRNIFYGRSTGTPMAPRANACIPFHHHQIADIARETRASKPCTTRIYGTVPASCSERKPFL